MILALVLLAAAPGHAADDAAIRALEARQEAAWNAHDANAYAALFTPDADVVNVLGWWWRGRDMIAARLTPAFAGPFARSRLTIGEIAIRYPMAGVAVAHVRWTMAGALSPDGSGGNVPRAGIQTQTLVLTQNGWAISAVQNTNGVPERPFAPPAR